MAGPDPALQEVWKPRFLMKLAETRSIAKSVEWAGIRRKTAYDARNADPDFAEQWDEALTIACETLEASALQRAMAGDTTLTIFLLKAWKPAIYRDNIRLEVVRGEIQQLADALGLNADDIMREADAILRASK